MTRRDPDEKSGSGRPESPGKRVSRSVSGKTQEGARGIYGSQCVFWIIVLCVSVCFLWSAFSGPQGVFSFVKQLKDGTRLEEENRKLLEQNHVLQKEIYLLSQNGSYVCRIAREELGYVDEGEDIYLRRKPSNEPAHTPPP